MQWGGGFFRRVLADARLFLMQSEADAQEDGPIRSSAQKIEGFCKLRSFSALCFALAIFHTWPIAADPHRQSLNANADAELNAWIVSWIPSA